MKQKPMYGFMLAIAALVIFMLPSGDSAQWQNPVKEKMAAINAQLEAMGENVRLAVVDFMTVAIPPGESVFYDFRLRLQDYHFVPGDPRRGDRYNITWMSDQVEGTANGVNYEATSSAIDNAMATWDAVESGTFALDKLEVPVNLGRIQWNWLYYGVEEPPPPPPFADINHAGWLPPEFFDYMYPDAGSTVISTSYTFIWVHPSGWPPTDIDGNGLYDVAFRESYYNNGTQWGINDDDYYDVESVVLHEAGHGFGLGHYGRIFTTPDGRIRFAPQAVMNIVYGGIKQKLYGPDKAFFGSRWDGWPYE